MIETYSDERRVRKVIIAVLLVGLLVLAIVGLIYLAPGASGDLSCGGG